MRTDFNWGKESRANWIPLLVIDDWAFSGENEGLRRGSQGLCGVGGGMSESRMRGLVWMKPVWVC